MEGHCGRYVEWASQSGSTTEKLLSSVGGKRLFPASVSSEQAPQYTTKVTHQQCKAPLAGGPTVA